MKVVIAGVEFNLGEVDFDAYPISRIHSVTYQDGQVWHLRSKNGNRIEFSRKEAEKLGEAVSNNVAHESSIAKAIESTQGPSGELVD